jgi:hypothetical protein
MFPRVDNGLIRHRHLGVKVRVVNPLPRGKLNVGLRLPRRFHCCRPLHAQTRGRCPGVGAQGSVPRGRCPVWWRNARHSGSLLLSVLTVRLQ